MKVSEVFLTIYFWCLAIPVLLVTYLVCIICYPFVDEKTFARIYETFTGKTMVFFMTVPGFWTLKVTDLRSDKSWKENNGLEKQYVIIANHLSYIDSMVIPATIELKIKFMIAHIFTHLPIFGWLTRCSGFVTADRNDPLLNKTAVERAVKAIYKDRSSFCIYCEGKRENIPYVFEKFHTGAFRIARATYLPILPVTLKGTYEGMRFKGIVGFADIEITIHESFHVTDDDYEKWIVKSKEIIQSSL
jgi:1-acyl-sn-glycerol-3-phosphate acyltransferase